MLRYINIIFTRTSVPLFSLVPPYRTCLKQVLDKSMELRTAVWRCANTTLVQLLPEGTNVLSSLVPWRFIWSLGTLSWALNQPAHPGTWLEAEGREISRVAILVGRILKLSIGWDPTRHSHFDRTLGISGESMVEVCFCAVHCFGQFHR